ncbi:MAG TPA: TIM barrel protein [Feifaniaceae bacterium]|nr:TIM barrel protein [Feifaniaceae bacterium]
MNSTKIGLGSYAYSYAVGFPGFLPKRPLSAFDLVDKAAQLDLPVLQIADNCPLDKLSPAELSELDAYARRHSIEMEVGTRGIGTEHLMRYIEIAKTLHAKLLRVVIDTAGHHPDFEEIIGLIARVLPLLTQNQIVLGIENHDRFKARVFADIVEAIDSPYVGIVLDTVNSFACEENTSQVTDVLARHTVNFHVKDFEIKRVENGMGLIVTGTPAGKGFLDIPEMERRLRVQARGDYSSVLELWMAPEPGMEETIKKEDRWVKESVAYLKRVLREPGSNKREENRR